MVKELAEMRDRIMREMSHREMDSRRELLTKRQKFLKKVFERAEKALIEYTQKAEYASLMERYAANIAKVLTEPGTVVYVKSGDEKYKAQIEKLWRYCNNFKVDDKIKIGGLRAENVAMRLAADETLDSILASSNVDGLKKIREWLWSEPEIPIYNGDEFDGKSECYIRH